MPIVIVGRWPDCEQGKGRGASTSVYIGKMLAYSLNSMRAVLLGCARTIYMADWSKLAGSNLEEKVTLTSPPNPLYAH